MKKIYILNETRTTILNSGYWAKLDSLSAEGLAELGAEREPDPPDFDSLTDRLGAVELSEGVLIWAVHKLTPEELAQAFELRKQKVVGSVQLYLDENARARGYDNIFTCISYVTSGSPTFNAEALAAAAWRDEVWLYCHEVLADVEVGGRPEPTVEEILAELPVINWEV